MQAGFSCFNNIPLPIPITVHDPIGVPCSLMATIRSYKIKSNLVPNKGAFYHPNYSQLQSFQVPLIFKD